MKLVAAGVGLVLLAGCSDGQVQKLEESVSELSGSVKSLTEENAKLKSQLTGAIKSKEALEEQVAKLSLTAPMLLKQATEAAASGDMSAAQNAVSTLATRFPGTQEHQAAGLALEGLNKREREKQEEAKRLAAMGFKALKIDTFQTDAVKVAMSSSRTVGEFVFDRYGDRYHYLDADRDHKYFVASLVVTAGKGVVNPTLPGMALYWVDSNRLRKLGDFQFRLASWSDYATYLGNYPDSRNDFAKTATIKFEAGVQVLTSDLARRPLYMVAEKAGCLHRHEGRFDRPPVSYLGACSALADSLSLEDFTSPESKVALVRRID